MDNITIELAQAQLAQQARLEMAWELFTKDGTIHLPTDDSWMESIATLP